MKKIFIILAFLFILTGCNNFSDKTDTENKQTKEIEKKEDISKKPKDVDSKLELLKKKIRLKGVIKEGDNFLNEANYMASILKYKQALKEIPNDVELNKKIGDLYYELKNFRKANEYYFKIKTSSKLDKDKAIKSFINSKGVNPGNLEDLKKEISSFDLDDEKKFYYETSLDCVIDFSNCRDEFEKYFQTNTTLSDENLKNIKTALDNFKNFSSKELYYKASFVSGAFFENAFYYLAMKTAEKVISKKPDYKPMLKVAGKSAYEIGKYTEAKDYLMKNKKLDSNDTQVSYFLARIYEKLNDKNLAIVHYKKALKDGYKDLADIYRRLIFIYFEEKQTEKMLSIFDKLLKLEKKFLNETDFSLAINYNIESGNLNKAKTYSIKAMRFFPESEIFFTYFSWILLQNENISEIELKIADRNIEKAMNINAKNPMVLMVKGVYELKKGDYNKSILYLKRAYGLDKRAEYKSEIKTWIDKLEEIKKEQ